MSMFRYLVALTLALTCKYVDHDIKFKTLVIRQLNNFIHNGFQRNCINLIKDNYMCTKKYVHIKTYNALICKLLIIQSIYKHIDE